MKIKKFFLLIFILLIFPAIFSVYTFEIGFRFYEFYQSNKIKQYSQQNEPRSKLDYYKDVLKNDPEAVINVQPGEYLNKENKDLFLPLSGISNVRTIICNESGYFSEYYSDRYGFNNPDYEWDKSEIDFLLLGDSFTHGDCVSRPNDIGSVIRSISKKSVLNLGYRDNGPLLEYATLREFGFKEIKNLLWLFYEGGDIYDLESNLRYKQLNIYLEDLNYSQKLKHKQKKIDQSGKKKITKLLNSTIVEKNSINYNSLIKLRKTRSIIKNRYNYYFKPSIFSEETNLYKKFKEIIYRTNEFSKKNNINFFFVYIPAYERYKNKEYNKTIYNNVIKIIEEFDIDFIDIHKDVFLNLENPFILYPFGQRGHFNEIGYREVGKKILNLVELKTEKTLSKE